MHWSRCTWCGRDLVTGFRKLDAVLLVVLVTGIAAYIGGYGRDPLRQAYDLAMSCDDYSLTDTAWMEWFERKGVSTVSGWVFYPPVANANDPESCDEIETALQNESNVGTLLRRLDR